MDMRELWGGLFWLTFSVLGCIASYRLGVGVPRVPGPGFFPFWSAAVLGFFSLVLLLVTALRKQQRVRLSDLWRGTRWHRVIWMVGPLMLYHLCLPLLGFLPTTFVFTALVTRIIKNSGWPWITLSALAIALGNYLLFQVLLGVSLPSGILGY
jgi:putative tricarboxylic transport membrane protein